MAPSGWSPVVKVQALMGAWALARPGAPRPRSGERSSWKASGANVVARMAGWAPQGALCACMGENSPTQANARFSREAPLSRRDGPGLIPCVRLFLASRLKRVGPGLSKADPRPWAGPPPPATMGQ